MESARADLCERHPERRRGLSEANVSPTDNVVGADGGLQRAAMVSARADLREGPDSRRIRDLVIDIVSPAVQAAAALHPAGMIIPGGNLSERSRELRFGSSTSVVFSPDGGGGAARPSPP